MIFILHNTVSDAAGADERDVLVQVGAVAEAISALGRQSQTLSVDLNLEALRTEFIARRPPLVFNLVESLGGSDRLAPLAAVLLEDLGISFTGSGADALYVAGSKRLTKQRLMAHGLPTPDAFFYDEPHSSDNAGASFAAGRYLLKAEHEHASFAMDDAALLDAESMDELIAALAERERRHGKPFFAERYIEGREFNVSLLERSDGTPEVLPVAEISFDSFPPDKPRIVGYAAKWNEESGEYQETPRRFEFPERDDALLASLRSLAERVWQILHLRGYARVDFRVDEGGAPWILEANANPCLSPDAGFAAALAHAGISYAAGIERIVGSLGR